MSSIPIAHFEERYASDPDPWGFAYRWYEARKYALTLAALPEPRYSRAFEPGCSIGVLTAALAGRCDYLLASDGVDNVLEQARGRVQGMSQVEITRLIVPDEWPDGPWDLVVVSEIGYYLNAQDLALLLERASASTVPRATLLAVHWRGETDYPQTGDAVHEAIAEHPDFERRGGYCEEVFRLDVYQRRP